MSKTTTKTMTVESLRTGHSRWMKIVHAMLNIRVGIHDLHGRFDMTTDWCNGEPATPFPDFIPESYEDLPSRPYVMHLFSALCDAIECFESELVGIGGVMRHDIERMEAGHQAAETYSQVEYDGPTDRTPSPPVDHFAALCELKKFQTSVADLAKQIPAENGKELPRIVSAFRTLHHTVDDEINQAARSLPVNQTQGSAA